MHIAAGSSKTVGAKTVHLSRLQAIMRSVDSQLQTFVRLLCLLACMCSVDLQLESDPECSVGLVTFSSTVSILGDGCAAPRVLSETEL